MNIKRVNLILSLSVLLCGSNQAAIVLIQNGNDLDIEIQNSITFELNRDVSSGRFGFTLPDAINVAGTGGFQLTSDVQTSPSILGNGLLASDPSVGLIRGGSSLEILYFVTNNVSLSEGDFVTLTAGELTLPGFFNFGIIQGLKKSTFDTVFLSETSGSLISAPTSTIPEPTIFSCYGIGLALLICRRRTRQ